MAILPTYKVSALVRKAARKLLPASGNRGIDMAAVRASIEPLRSSIPGIRSRLKVTEDLSVGTTLSNLQVAYARLDGILVSGLGLRKGDVLELNLACLFGDKKPDARDLEQAVGCFRTNFGRVWEGYKSSAKLPPWKRAALVFSEFVTDPQPCSEANKRTGLLTANYILVSAGLKPFFMTAQNAKDLLDISFQQMFFSRLSKIVPASAIDMDRSPEQLKADLAEMFRKHSAPASRA